MSEGRLQRGPAEQIDREGDVSFAYGGRTVRAHPGDTIGSALAASGHTVFTRSFKYHRPRGLLCVNGRCPNCLVTVDGIPNVRSCATPVREGMAVEHQNAWPGLRVDLMSLTDRFDRLLPVGFYYKTFIHPRRLWPVYERVLRKAAGLGRIDPAHPPDLHPSTRHLHCDVAVVGGGPAGCLAALEAAEAGASVILVDDQPALGGHLRIQGARAAGDERIAGLAGYEAAAHLRTLVAADARIEHLADATAFGLYEGGLLGVSQGEVMSRIRARRIVLGTGAQERPALFDRNDLPGVMLGTGALRLARLFGVRPGSTAVVLADDAHGWRIAAELVDAGVHVSTLLDTRPLALVAEGAVDEETAARVRAGGIEVLADTRVLAAAGRGRLRRLRVSVAGTERTIACDLLAMSLRPEPVTALLAHDGGAREFDASLGEWIPAGDSAMVIVAGDMTGLLDDAFAAASGVRAGRAAALGAGRGAAGALDAAERALETARDIAARRPVNQVALDPGPGHKRFVCVCEDVTSKEIRDGIAEGFDSLETLKRYSTLTMGPCQGKMCHSLGARLAAATTGRSIADTGLTTARPPFQPVALATIAGPHLDPVRRTPMHDRHEALGARWTDMGDWKRPHSYPAGVAAECRAVHTAAGLIDVTTLGKIEVRGADAGTFLDWLHPNRFSDLRVGRVRYRAMTDESGILLDDGTVARLGPDRFLVSTTTGSLDAVDQWLRWWLAGSDRDVEVTNVTSQYAAVNLAGPRAREILAKVTELDVSRSAMPYLAAAEGVVAGIPAMILRIGFVGEVGFEIHVPADYGAHLWDALMVAGEGLGLAPFGVEAQRVLRLEKGHVIVGHDTDGISNPIESGLGWLVKSDKADFVGRRAIADVAARGAQQALVLFALDNGNDADVRIRPARGRRDRPGDGSGRTRDEREMERSSRSRDRDGVGAGRRGGERDADRDPPRRAIAAGNGPHGAVLRPRRRAVARMSPERIPAAEAPVPTRRSPIEASRATAGDRGGSPGASWPTDYGDPSAETEAARHDAVLVDWGPLDKLTIKGRQIGAALAAIGLAFRPGEITAPDGGAPGLQAWGLAHDEALVLASDATADLASRAVAAGGSVVDVSSGFAALRLVGPRARAVLERLCPVDLAPDALRDQRVTFGPIANVRVTIGRDDVRREDLGVDLTAFTLLLARDQARYLWDVLLYQGASFGLRQAGLAVLAPSPISGRR